MRGPLTALFSTAGAVPQHAQHEGAEPPPLHRPARWYRSYTAASAGGGGGLAATARSAAEKCRCETASAAISSCVYDKCSEADTRVEQQ